MQKKVLILILVYSICVLCIAAVTQINLTKQVIGTLPVLNGGTGVTTSTGTGNTVLSATPSITGGITISGSNFQLAVTSGTTDFIVNTGSAGKIELKSASGTCINASTCTPTSGILFDSQGITRLAGHTFYHSTAPTIGGTGCTAVTGSVDQRGAITLSLGATSCTVTFGTSFSKPMPMVSASTLLITPVITSVSTTILTIGVSSATGTVYYYIDDVD